MRLSSPSSAVLPRLFSAVHAPTPFVSREGVEMFEALLKTPDRVLLDFVRPDPERALTFLESLSRVWGVPYTARAHEAAYKALAVPGVAAHLIHRASPERVFNLLTDLRFSRVQRLSLVQRPAVAEAFTRAGYGRLLGDLVEWDQSSLALDAELDTLFPNG